MSAGQIYRPRSKAYDHIAAWLPGYVNEHGELPTYATVQQFLRVEHALASSSTTVKRALATWSELPANKALLDACRQRTRDQVMQRPDTGSTISAGEDQSSPHDPLLATALTALRASIREEERRRIQADADAQIEQMRTTADADIRQALLAKERTELLYQQADRARLAAEAHASACAREMDVRVQDVKDGIAEFVKQLAGDHATQLQALEQQLEARTEAVAAPLREALAREEKRRHDLQAENTKLAETIDALQGKLLASEQSAAAQHSEITKHWAGELNRSREETQQAQSALRKAVAAKDDAVRAARTEATEAIAQALNALRESVGGVNAVHNTHLGAITAKIEELSVRVGKLVPPGGPVKRPKALPRETSAGRG